LNIQLTLADLVSVGNYADSATGFKVLDTGAVRLYKVSYSAAGSITNNFDDLATTLSGGFAGSRIWAFEYQDALLTWQPIDVLLAPGTTNVTGSINLPDESGEKIITAQKFRISYDATLSAAYLGPLDPSDVLATAGSTGGLRVKAVPEASTLIGFGSALVMAGPGMIGWLRRRRS
jgi:hypothetical protein